MNELLDPTGWTVENNPHKWSFPIDEKQRDKHGHVWQDFHEFTPDGMPLKCHSCLHRALYDNGNCIDGGEYFICLPKSVREGKRSLPKKTKQTKLM